MRQNNESLWGETERHIIEVSEGCLTIDEKKFPDDCVSLSAEETETLLRLLLMHKYGAKIVEELEVLLE